MLCLYLESPFAAFRTFTAGWYRPSASFLTPSAAYGLVLNVAAIESRLREEDPDHSGRVPATLTRPNLPRCRLAIGIPAAADGSLVFPRPQSVFQQLHNYPVGKDAGMPPEMAKGNKNNITPVRREFLMNLRATIAIDGNADLENRVIRGLAGEFNDVRYGLPFLGDNQFLPNRLEQCQALPKTFWYQRAEESGDGPQPGVTRMTVRIDRADMSGTTSMLLAPSPHASTEVPMAAWVDLGGPEN